MDKHIETVCLRLYVKRESNVAPQDCKGRQRKGGERRGEEGINRGEGLGEEENGIWRTILPRLEFEFGGIAERLLIRA